MQVKPDDNFEFDKVVLALAIGLFTIIMSANLGDMLYNPRTYVAKRGFQIEIVESNAEGASAGSTELPALLDMKAIMAGADASKGEVIFKKCAVCHVNVKGGANKVGPNLWGIIGAKTATHEGFAYSTAMQQRAAEGKAWGYEDLYRYLYAPKKFVPGTKMAFAGLKKDQERADLIAFLRAHADNPEPLP